MQTNDFFQVHHSPSLAHLENSGVIRVLGVPPLQEKRAECSRLSMENLAAQEKLPLPPTTSLNTSIHQSRLASNVSICPAAGGAFVLLHISTSVLPTSTSSYDLCWITEGLWCRLKAWDSNSTCDLRLIFGIHNFKDENLTCEQKSSVL